MDVEPADPAPARAAAAVPGPGVRVPRRFHVAPLRSGKADGSGWADAGSLADVRNFVREADGGDEILLRSDAGPYREGTVTVAHGGEPGRPVVIRGVDPSGRGTAPALFVGSRANPWAEGLPKGAEVFRLMTGANHLVFENMEFRDVGNGCFRLAGQDVTDVVIRHMRASNVIRFVQNERSGAPHASVHDLEVTDVQVDRFSENVLKLKYDSSDVVVRDVRGDSRQADLDFTMGVHLSGTTHDVLFERVRMDNAQYSGKRYWNGDGFAAERGTYRLTFRDTYAGGNADAGYDLKADGVLMERAVAVGNNRNFRFWASDVVARDIVSVAPERRGGSSSRHHLWVSHDAHRVDLHGPVFRDGADLTAVYLEKGAHVRLFAESWQGASSTSRLEAGALLERLAADPVQAARLPWTGAAKADPPPPAPTRTRAVRYAG